MRILYCVDMQFNYVNIIMQHKEIDIIVLHINQHKLV